MLNQESKDFLEERKVLGGKPLQDLNPNEARIQFNKAKEVFPLPEIEILSVENKEIHKIIKNTKKTLKKAISLGGSSLRDFSSSDGKKGEFQQYFYVYGRKGENCLNRNCNKKIIKTIIGNRATFYCPKCQK